MTEKKEKKKRAGLERQKDGAQSPEAKKETTKKPRSFWRIFGLTSKWFAISILMAFGTLVVLGVVLVFSVYANYAKSFKTAKIKNNSTQNVFYDQDNTVIYESYGTGEPEEVKLSDMPEIVKKATLAAEDANFYQHGAIDPRGLLRAAINNIQESDKAGAGKLADLFSEGDYSSGGSTITQQLVKNLYLTSERSFERKIKEIVYSFELEKQLSKDQILEKYLNNVYYGEQSLGVANAARTYYGKPLSDLSLAEVTMLAGLPVAPTKLDPISGDPEAAKERQEYVLTQMVNRGDITLDEAKKAANEPLYFVEEEKIDLVLKHPYFVDYVKNELIAKLGQDVYDRGGLSVMTTLNSKNQNVAEAQAATYMKKFAYRKVTNTAIVVLDNDKGTISALLGGVNYDKSKINMAVSPRQPGSSFKPIAYTAGLLNGYTAATRLVDSYVNFGGIPPYIPHNYDGGYRGNITVHYALANSLNIPAVEMTKLVGVEKVIDTARKFGISSINRDPNSYGLSIGLGSAEVSPFEMTRAFSVFANGGMLNNYTGIESITDSTGTKVYTFQKYGAQAFDARVAYIMANILSDNQARSLVFGTYNPLTLKDRVVAAKTGTTDDYADSWTIGFTPQFTVGVWMGNNDRTKMTRVSGIEGAAYIWQDTMKGIHSGLPAKQFVKPDGLASMWVNAYTGLPANSHYRPNILEYFIPGTEPTKNPNLNYLKQFSLYYRTSQ